jgi:hypothetical protein
MEKTHSKYNGAYNLDRQFVIKYVLVSGDKNNIVRNCDRPVTNYSAATLYGSACLTNFL